MPIRIDRRRALLGAGAAGAALSLSPVLKNAAAASTFSAGPVRHILPSATHERFVIKLSLHSAPSTPPLLRVGDQLVPGKQSDTEGLFFIYDVSGLAPDTEYPLQLVDRRGHALTSAWPLRTFPAPAARPRRFRLAAITCAGGRDEFIDPRPDGDTDIEPQFQPLRIKRRILARALEFQPDALHANGDHIYWDLRSVPSSLGQGMSPQAALIGPGFFDRNQPVLGTHNETILKNGFGPQIADLYGVDWRSTPVYFVVDDHDYTDNDEANELQRTFPPDRFMREVARTTQAMYYPELFTGGDFPVEYDTNGLSRDFGLLRYGKLFEGLIYNAKGQMTNTRDPQSPDYQGNSDQAGHPESRLVPEAIEEWLLQRTADTDAAHLAHIPSSPILWGAGKFAEWYPDALGDDGHLTSDEDKPYWPDGWNLQHDRLLKATSEQERIPLWISGDLHASALGTISRTNDTDLSANPVVSLCCGTPGTGEPGFPSSFRGVRPEPSTTVTAHEIVPAIEENGFSIVDFTPSHVTVSMFAWDYRTQPEADIDSLQPFHVQRFRR